MYVFSPLPAIAGAASAVQGNLGLAALLLVIAAVLFFGGRRTRGQRERPVG
jgi:hypothetical protein